jgi:signal transduction histidine kinase
MAAVVAHEVKNPLAGIKGAMQVLMSRRQPDDMEVIVMRDIVARIDALNELIADLTMYARPRPARLAKVNLRHLIDEAIVMLRRDPAGASIEIEVSGDVGGIMADVDLVRATVLNLLLNSAQAMNGQGRIRVAATQRDGKWTLEVTDNGPGIPADIREQVLEPFFTTKARGGGLGLAIARRVAELHGGILALAFPASGGTVVTISAPVTPPRAEGETSQSGSAPGPG